MALNRRYLRRSLQSSLLGIGAVRWLSPRARRWFILSSLIFGMTIGIVAGVLGAENWAPDRIAVVVVLVMLVPFIAYDVMLSYLLLERRDLEGEMAVAARIQAGLLPGPLPQHPRWECAGRSRAARAVGGDSWEVLPLGDGRWLLSVADVSGKGVPAAILMAGLRTRLHLLAAEDPQPARLAARLNDAMAAETEPTEFSTLLLVLLDADAETVTWVNAGHPPGLLLRADGGEERLTPGGIPVGMLDGSRYQERTVAWHPGDRLLLYSDGVLDAAIDERGPMQPADLSAVLRSGATGDTASGMVAAVFALVAEATAGRDPADDVTVLACRFS